MDFAGRINPLIFPVFDFDYCDPADGKTADRRIGGYGSCHYTSDLRDCLAPHHQSGNTRFIRYSKQIRVFGDKADRIFPRGFRTEKLSELFVLFFIQKILFAAKRSFFLIAADLHKRK